MSATGLDVFDRTLQITHVWLDDIMAELGPDRQRAYHALRAVLHALRDRLPLNLAAHPRLLILALPEVGHAAAAFNQLSPSPRTGRFKTLGRSGGG
jgi:uncharacterized protein (DUF2267 family)